MKHFKIKVCGIRRANDAALVSQFGADMIGMIFTKESKRYITQKIAKEIIAEIRPTVSKVGVFMNQPIKEILKIADRLQLDFIQLHGIETNKVLVQLAKYNYKTIKALHLTENSEFLGLNKIKADIILLDNRTATDSGGTGSQFDWSIRPKKIIRNLALSGGISTENLKEGLSIYKPILVDINSSVESSPGIKSKKKLKSFFELANKLRYGK